MPFAVTVDYDTVGKDTVTLRERDSRAQVMCRRSTGPERAFTPPSFAELPLLLSVRSHVSVS